MNISDLCQEAKKASYHIAALYSGQKNSLLAEIANELDKNRSVIIRENNKDLSAGRSLSAPMLDRLRLDNERINSMIRSVNDISALNDPVGEVIYSSVRPGGIEVQKVRMPLGLVGVIYESRPNVTIDTACLCLKSGNACVLRGGKEALFSNRILADIIQKSLSRSGLPGKAVSFIDNPDRALAAELLKQKKYIDLIIPRGGAELINFVTENSMIPLIKHDKGVCTIYIESDADPVMASRICENAKVQRPGVCNAAENILFHSQSACIKPVLEKLTSCGVEIYGCPRIQAIFPACKSASEEDWSTEYLALKISVKMVDSLDEAVDFIHTYGSGHTEAIITSSWSKAREFQRRVDSGVVMVNASTRFSDGGCFGLGAEVGISTQKLHVRGPMGLSDLTCGKFIVNGNGQIRE
ncbi:MAG: glutamate-5-semialdehyde dehydrogenase [Spirochaetes bacterium GWF1_41_5]|nr:MAG: glutamate-5-semialdehyde dehydrogenase [Spirochaetes bacterium GWF1_41_5]